MTWAELVAEVKKEARIAGDAEFDTLVLSLLNEYQLEAAMSAKPPELRDVVELTSPYPLPADLLTIETVEYDGYQLRPYDKPAWPTAKLGYPQRYLQGTPNLKLFPAPTYELPYKTVSLSYYKTPTKVTEALTGSPLERLTPYILRATIRRVRLFHDGDASVANALQSDVQSAASAIVKDEPISDSGLNRSGK